MSIKHALAALCAAALALPAAAQEWEYSQGVSAAALALGAAMPQTSTAPSGSRTVRVTEGAPGVLTVVERTPSSSSGNICVARPRSARLEMSSGLQVLTIAAAIHGCPETRYVFQKDGSGWEEQKDAGQWVKTGGVLRGNQPVRSAQAAPEATPAVAAAQPAPRPTVAEPAPPPAATPVAVSQPAADNEVERPVPALPRNGHRRALVIGNDSYRHTSKLLNARADARAMGLALERAGFEVTTRFDVDARALRASLREFKASVEGGDEVIVFYSGHGVQIGGINYLLPVDIQGESEDQLRDDSVPLQRVLDDVSERHARFMLAMIDACRDNPFKGSGNGRSLGAARGLAPTTAATGQMIIYSAGSGQQALDRLSSADHDPNGLFTRVFLKQMEVPGVPIDRVLRNVRNEVVRMARAVGHEQTPALYDQTVGDFYLRPTH